MTGAGASLAHLVFQDDGDDQILLILQMPDQLTFERGKAGVKRQCRFARVLRLQSIVGQVQTMVEECGDPTNFDAAAWTGDWLTAPQPALGGRQAMEFLGTVTGLQLLSDLLMKNVTGAYA